MKLRNFLNKPLATKSGFVHLREYSILFITETHYFSPWWKFWKVDKQTYYRLAVGHPADYKYAPGELKEELTYRPIEELESHIKELKLKRLQFT